MMIGKLIFQDGTEFVGQSFGRPKSVAGEVVFSTGMVGYPESLTDPSYRGQILVLTYPLVGNYGVPEKKFWESGKIQVAGLIVSNYIDTPSHPTSRRTLGQWLSTEGIPALEIKDTRFLAQKLRTHGVMLGKMTFEKSNVILGRPRRKVGGDPGIHSPRSQPVLNCDWGSRASLDSRPRSGRGQALRGNEKIGFEDPNNRNLVAEVSTKKIKKLGRGRRRIVLIDCGAKRNIERSLAARGVEVMVVPWNYNIFKLRRFSGVVVSNGPGNPKMAKDTIAILQKALAHKIPILGICLGNQILTLAAGGDTRKLKFGHRGQNQPCLLVGSKRCYLTTQNHGYVVSRIPKGFKPWFVNANDGTNEGLIHPRQSVMSVQFHPEASPGPTDTGWIFDYFLKRSRLLPPP